MIKDLFLANNNSDSLRMFEYRKLYKNKAMTASWNKTLDLWYNEELDLYGKVDYNNRPMILPENNLTQISSPKGTFLALNFVVDAFEDLQNYFKAALLKRAISTDGPLTTINPKRSWESALTNYHSHMEFMYRIFVIQFLQETNKKEQIYTFEDFIEVFLQFAKEYKNTLPFTRSSYIKSRLCPPYISGMMIEIGDGDKGDDYSKQKYLEDSNFYFYSKAAKKFGFYIDKNIPYRLMADIMSPAMARKMKKYGVNRKEVFSSFFRLTEIDDYEILRAYIIHMWTSFVASYPQAKKTVCKKTEMIAREFVSEGYTEQYDLSFWLNFYCKVLALGADKEIKESFLKRVIDNSILLSKSVDTTTALRYTHTMIL